MGTARLVYGALIRLPVFGPVVRLPLRLLRWLYQPPERDAAVRADRLETELEILREQHQQLALAHEGLCRDQERTRLVVYMISGQLHPRIDKAFACDAERHAAQ